MKSFVKDNSRMIYKLLINQFGAAFFGVLVYSAAANLGWLNLLTGVFAVLFYMYLLYSCMWDEGARDRIRVDGGRMNIDMKKGVKLALVANIPNIILGVLLFVFTALNVLTQTEWTGNIAYVANAISVLWEGMYNGLITTIFPRMIDDTVVELTNLQIILRAFSYIVIVLPSLLTCNIAYKLGYNGITIIKTSSKKAEKKK